MLLRLGKDVQTCPIKGLVSLRNSKIKQSSAVNVSVKELQLTKYSIQITSFDNLHIFCIITFHIEYLQVMSSTRLENRTETRDTVLGLWMVLLSTFTLRQCCFLQNHIDQTAAISICIKQDGSAT